MRLSCRKTRSSLADLPMTSMIDVVFLLLIFFMVTSSWLKAERELDPGIQVRDQGASNAIRDLEPARVDVVAVAGRVVYQLGGRSFDSIEELTSILSQFGNKSDGSVVRVADSVPFDSAAAAIQACKSAGFTQVSYVPGGGS